MEQNPWLRGFSALAVVGIFIIGGCVNQPQGEGEKEDIKVQLPPAQEAQTPQLPPPEEPEKIKPKAPTWEYGGVAIAGKYADAEVVELEDGSYRMCTTAQSLTCPALRARCTLLFPLMACIGPLKMEFG